MVLSLGRLVAYGVLPDAPWLGPVLLSHYVAHGKGVESAIKEVCR